MESDGTHCGLDRTLPLEHVVLRHLDSQALVSHHDASIACISRPLTSNGLLLMSLSSYVHMACILAWRLKILRA